MSDRSRFNLRSPGPDQTDHQRQPQLSVLRCYSSLDEAEKCLEYTRKSVEAVG